MKFRYVYELYRRTDLLIYYPGENFQLLLQIWWRRAISDHYILCSFLDFFAIISNYLYLAKARVDMWTADFLQAELRREKLDRSIILDADINSDNISCLLGGVLMNISSDHPKMDDLQKRSEDMQSVWALLNSSFSPIRLLFLMNYTALWLMNSD